MSPLTGFIATKPTYTLYKIRSLSLSFHCLHATIRQAMLSLLRDNTPAPKGDPNISSHEDPLSLMFLGVFRMYCRKRDVMRALATMGDMEDMTGRKADAGAFLVVLDACSEARPPLLRETEAVWSQIEVRGVRRGRGDISDASSEKWRASCVGCLGNGRAL